MVAVEIFSWQYASSGCGVETAYACSVDSRIFSSCRRSLVFLFELLRRRRTVARCANDSFQFYGHLSGDEKSAQQLAVLGGHRCLIGVLVLDEGFGYLRRFDADIHRHGRLRFFPMEERI